MSKQASWGWVAAIGCLVATTGCYSSRNHLAQNAIVQIWERESSRIGACFQPAPGDMLRANAAWMDDGLYLVFSDSGGSQAVVFDLGAVQEGTITDIVNSGFARLQPNRHWSLFHTNEQSLVFEPNGGVWTFKKLANAVEVALTSKPVKTFTWR